MRKLRGRKRAVASLKAKEIEMAPRNLRGRTKVMMWVRGSVMGYSLGWKMEIGHTRFWNRSQSRGILRTGLDSHHALERT